MTFPNAYRGVKKVFTAQLLKIIGAFCMIVGSIMGIIAMVIAMAAGVVDLTSEAVDSTALTLGIVALVLVVGGGVLQLIAYIMNIVGLRQGGADEEAFHMGFIVACFGMIIKFVSILFTLLNVGGGIADNIADTITYVCDIVIIVSVLNGISNLAARIGNEKIETLGRKLINIVTAIIGLSAIATIVPVFFGPAETFQTIQGILMLVAGSLSLVGYIIYLVFLGKSVKMLKEN